MLLMALPIFFFTCIYRWRKCSLVLHLGNQSSCIHISECLSMWVTWSSVQTARWGLGFFLFFLHAILDLDSWLTAYVLGCEDVRSGNRHFHSLQEYVTNRTVQNSTILFRLLFCWDSVSFQILFCFKTLFCFIFVKAVSLFWCFTHKL